jgi:carbon-monoxide dehydrogenase medium subunit
MKLHRPETLADAVRLLAAEDGTMCLGGGATLVAMLNADLLAPPALVSLKRVAGLADVSLETDGAVRIGAMASHATVARSGVFSDGQRIVPDAASRIGHPAVRNMGTIGGAICHADPAADYPPALVAAGAEIELAGTAGARRVTAEDFFLGYYETARAPGEVAVAVRVPRAPAGTVAVFEKFARVEGDFATVSVALVLGMANDACTYARIALGGCGPRPVRVAAAEERLVGSRLAGADVGAAGAALCDAADPVDDVRGSAAYRLKLIPRLLERAVRSAGDKGR